MKKDIKKDNEKPSVKVPCNFRNGQKIMIPMNIGDPAIGAHPFNFQSRWLADKKGGVIPTEIMDTYAKLKHIADINRVSFHELCEFVAKETSSAKEAITEYNKANALLEKNKKSQSNNEQK